MNPFSPIRHAVRPPDVPELLRILKHHDIQYVLTGSVAAAVYGVELKPGDLDVVPQLTADNLHRVVSVLKEIEAQPLGTIRPVDDPRER